MGWDFTVTPYDEARWPDVEATAAGGVEAIRARIEAEVPADERDQVVLGDLYNPSGWTTALLQVLAVRGPGVFFGRSFTVADFADLADPPLAADLRPLASVVDPLLSEEDGDAEDQRHRWPPATVARIAAHAERLGIPALSATDVDGLMAASRALSGRPGVAGVPLTDDHPAVRALGWTAAEVTALLGDPHTRPGLIARVFGRPTNHWKSHLLRLFLGHLRFLAAAGYGAVLSHDDLGAPVRRG